MKLKRIVPVVIVLALVALVAWQYPRFYIATGYGAKCLASGVFVAHRNADQVIAQDLDYSIVKYTHSKIDYKKKTVTTSFLGMAHQTAVYREGLGCTLVGDMPESKVRAESHQQLAPQPADPFEVAWPNGDQLKDTIFPEINYTKLKKAMDDAFDHGDEDLKRTAAVVVVYKNQLVGEEYWTKEGITPETRMWGWSMDKSIINTMLGVLSREGKLDVNEPAPIPEWQNDERKNITVNNLMHMSSGLKWDEDYGNVSDVTVMLYRKGDVYKAAVKAPYGVKPGTQWYYSSGTTNILSGMIRHIIGNDDKYLDFPRKEIFNKIGMRSMLMETDAAGNFVGSSYGYATARDWARFGLLYLNNGVWQGDTIVSPEWVKYTRTPAPASTGNYGAQFWLNRDKSIPDAPEDMFYCDGHRGQRIFIMPSKKLVVVRLGFSLEHFSDDTFLKEVLSAFQSDKQ
ncbi:serine hydrolase [Prolixibacter sp. NT017]|uniref:serine hydrolase domain-containing protein n=1 Tax=Prolixibacter sp. NT017 TaxID=2652390 RepID=UPI00126FDCDE|nr:serine hydrolase [Prolixibacter sp. NT017]GET24872.1 serine hydrolase [Prolixibacter sp. NT017]